MDAASSAVDAVGGTGSRGSGGQVVGLCDSATLCQDFVDGVDRGLSVVKGVEQTHGQFGGVGVQEPVDAFDVAVDDAKDALTNGPSAASWKRIEDAGLMTGREIFLFGGRPDPAVDFVPEEDWTSEEVARWWSTLAPNQQEHAMEEYPDDLRNLNGVPVTVRDELNRAKLEQEIERPSGAGMGHMTYSWEQLREIEEILTADDKYLIHFDPYANGGGEAAISTGNPDHADNVSTLVPGMLNDMGTLEVPIARSEAIHEQMQGDQPDADHASIVWMGYNAPIGGGFDPQESAERLVEFQDGLRATHEGDQPSHNTVIGHSFGAFVAGAADNPKIGGGLNADAMVLVGGPGASTDNITDLSMVPENIHIVLGEDDWINDARRWGLDEHFGVPLQDDEFFENPDDPGEELGNRLDPTEETGHSEYFEDEQTLDYLGDLMPGK